jgi:hypothetical protein
MLTDGRGSSGAGQVEKWWGLSSMYLSVSWLYSSHDPNFASQNGVATYRRSSPPFARPPTSPHRLLQVQYGVSRYSLSALGYIAAYPSAIFGCARLLFDAGIDESRYPSS